MSRKFIISHSVTGTILYYPRRCYDLTLASDRASSQACPTVRNGDSDKTHREPGWESVIHNRSRPGSHNSIRRNEFAELLLPLLVRSQ